MVDFSRSAGGECKTGLYTCLAGAAVTAGNIVKPVAGGTCSKSSGNTMKTSIWCVGNIAGGDSGNLVFGIAKNSATTTSSPSGGKGDVEVIPLVNGDVISLPFCGLDSAFSDTTTNIATVVGGIYAVSQATSGAFSGKTILLYAASPVTEAKCFRVLAFDTTSGYAECQYVGATTVA